MIAALAAAGFDLVHAFDAGAIARELGLTWLDDPARRVGLLVGNTRALWPRFLAGKPDGPDPLDRYTESVIDPIPAPHWFVHRRYDGAFLPFQRIAVAAGFGVLSPTHLVIHPTYGPWFALRALLLVDGEPPPTRPIAPPCACDRACRDAFERACAATGPDRWRAWVAVRDACPVGREHRYDDDQLEFHYAAVR